MSALPPKADIADSGLDVRQVPEALGVADAGSACCQMQEFPAGKSHGDAPQA